MKKLLLAMPLCLVLSGCFEKENPVAKLPDYHLQRWLKNNHSPEMVECASLWAYPENASPDQLANCRETQEAIAAQLTKSDLTNEEIQPEDLELPLIWKIFLIKHEQQKKSDARAQARYREIRVHRGN